MDTIVLEAQTRDNTVAAAALRRMKKIPAIVYGPGTEPVTVAMEYQTFRRTFMEAGESSLIDMSIDGKKSLKVLIHDVQYDPISSVINHVDFLNVRMDHLLTTYIPVELVGVAPAVKDFGGILTVPHQQIQVRCLPGDLVKSFIVDVSTLKTFQDVIHVSDLKASDKIQILLDADQPVVTIIPPRKEEEAAPAAAAAATPVAGAAPAAGAPGAPAAAAAAKPAAKK